MTLVKLLINIVDFVIFLKVHFFGYDGKHALTFEEFSAFVKGKNVELIKIWNLILKLFLNLKNNLLNTLIKFLKWLINSKTCIFNLQLNIWK